MIPDRIACHATGADRTEPAKASRDATFCAPERQPAAACC